MRILLLLIAVLTATPAVGQDLVLRVRATRVKATELCANCTPTNLLPSYWTIYEANVRDVVSGDFDEKTVRFAFAQHAQYTPRALKDFVVVLTPAPDWLRAQMQVDYAAIDIKFTGPGA
jgi:hypothetical protein